MKMNSILAAYRNNHQIINARIVNDEDIYVAKLFSSGDIIEPGEAGHTLFLLKMLNLAVTIRKISSLLQRQKRFLLSGYTIGFRYLLKVIPLLQKIFPEYCLISSSFRVFSWKLS